MSKLSDLSGLGEANGLIDRVKELYKYLTGTANPTEDYQVTNLDRLIVIDSSSQKITATMPASPVEGKPFSIVCKDVTNGAEVNWNGNTFYGESTNWIFEADEESIEVHFDGSTYVT